ncbi:unnamed protein product [Gongylonema pulchrum]|uniref:Uncharacterized protein n=1 Tax=Gongylonema pulchrum TaxID=637853 RepID=A0A183DY92_9BILA|nr:unnamed protein product [Gongylonema pulchrum]
MATFRVLIAVLIAVPSLSVAQNSTTPSSSVKQERSKEANAALKSEQQYQMLENGRLQNRDGQREYETTPSSSVKQERSKEANAVLKSEQQNQMLKDGRLQNRDGQREYEDRLRENSSPSLHSSNASTSTANTPQSKSIIPITARSRAPIPSFNCYRCPVFKYRPMFPPAKAVFPRITSPQIRPLRYRTPPAGFPAASRTRPPPPPYGFSYVPYNLFEQPPPYSHRPEFYNSLPPYEQTSVFRNPNRQPHPRVGVFIVRNPLTHNPEFIVRQSHWAYQGPPRYGNPPASVASASSVSNQNNSGTTLSNTIG